MTIEEKIQALQTCLINSEDIAYSINVFWGSDPQTSKLEIIQILNNARELLFTGRINQLDYDVRQQTVDNLNALLDSKLAMFPEYRIENQEKLSTTHTM